MEDWITEINAFEHMYRTIPDGQEHKNGYHRIKKTWQTLRILVINVFSFSGVMNLWKLK
jgi:hypothetical protein